MTAYSCICWLFHRRRKYCHIYGVVFGLNSSLYKILSAVIDLLSVSGLYSTDILGILVTKNCSCLLLPSSTKSTTLVQQQLQNWLFSIYLLSSQLYEQVALLESAFAKHLPCLDVTMYQCVHIFLIPRFHITFLYHS